MVCALAAQAPAQGEELYARIEAASSREELQAALDSAPLEIRSDPYLRKYFEMPVQEQIESIRYYEGEHRYSWRDLKREISYTLAGKIANDRPVAEGKVSDAKKEAEKILENPIYVDRGDAKDRNWLGNVADRIGAKILKWLESLMPKWQDRDLNLPNLNLPVLRFLVWAVVGVVIAALLFFVLRAVRIGKRSRRVGGILDEDEPERTADEWLVMADGLAAEGKFRESVRCLYLACLVKYDDANVASFRRHETNWEHLYRIEASLRNPGLDFRSLTQAFDKVWYGGKVRGEEDFVEFRSYYESLVVAFKVKVPA